MVNYSNMTVTELKSSLEQSGVPADVLSTLKKKELIELHKETTIVDEVNLDEDFEEIDEIDVFEEPYAGTMDSEAPAYNSREWSDYVMTKFDKSELIDGNPICAGLRRVSELMLGTIIESGPEQVFPSTDANKPGRATVVYKVVIDWMNTGYIKTFREVADVWHGNTDDLFCAHPVATASTRAEGRALRKALKIRALAAEELARKDIVSIVQATTTNADWNPEDNISNQQVTFINNKCKQLDIDVRKFVNMGSTQYESISNVTRNTAQKMLRQLNDYQQKGGIPEQIQGYESDWRE
tara:strand:- start:7411 stop:8298 length:888 start_codon:yes stop_codon:yes gene_type:complete